MSELRYCYVPRHGDCGTGSELEHSSCPLQHVSVTGVIRDAVAQYTVVQTFANPSTDTAIEAAYSFPLYEGVAVIGFEAEIENGRKIIGEVQEKGAARKAYEDAKQEGRIASLLEEQTGDVFQASIGNIPPSKSVSIRITVITDLKQDGEDNQLRFVVPISIAPRYGVPPLKLGHSNVDASTCKLLVDIRCEMSKPITSIQSPSHTIGVHLGTEPNQAGVSLTSDEFLDCDIVIVVQSMGLDEPRALVERHARDGTHAISLTFVPRFTHTPIRSSELIFVVDRSGSMQGNRIEQAGAALEIFLRSIPCEDHYFNVIGFGSTHQALFPTSVAYTEESLKEGVRYAQTLEADMGGTEMMSAFEEAFRQRRRDVSTQIFVLTDGEIWDVDSLCELIDATMKDGNNPNAAFVRVFSLGIGNAVSHNLIESVARVGGGYAQLAVEGERMEKKVLKMLKAALVPPVTNLRVQWSDPGAWNSLQPLGDASSAGINDEDDFVFVETEDENSQPAVETPEPAEETSQPAEEMSQPESSMVVVVKPTTTRVPIKFFSDDPSPPSPPPTLPVPDIIAPIEQAPFNFPILCGGARFTVYGLLASAVPVPKELFLRGASADGPVELKVPINILDDGDSTLLHSLAARALVRDLEERSSCIHALGNKSRTVPQQQMLERLGIHMVTEGKPYPSVHLHSKYVAELTNKHIVDIAMRYKLSSTQTSWVAIDQETQKTIIQSIITQPVPDKEESNFFMYTTRCATVRTISSYGDAQISLCSAAFDFENLSGMAALSGDCDSEGERELVVTQDSECEKEPKLVVPDDPHARLRSLLQHQSFDGSFPLVPEILALLATTVEELNAKLEELCKKSGVEWERVWATCLAVDFMRTQLPELRDEWELVVEKAERRVQVLAKGEDLEVIKHSSAALVAAAVESGNGIVSDTQLAEDVPSIQEVPVLTCSIKMSHKD